MPKQIDVAERKSQLVDAMWSVIHLQGVSAVSLRTVAATAGISAGSLRYVFPTRASLLLYAAQLMVERASERIRAIPRDTDPLGESISMLLNLVPRDDQSRTEMEINVALVAESAAHPDLIAVRDHARLELFNLCYRILGWLRDDASPEVIATHAKRLHVLIDGIAFQLLQDDPQGNHGWATELIELELQNWVLCAPGPHA